MRTIARASGLVTVLLAGAWAASAGAQTPLDTAKESYAAAEYDRCLSALDSIGSGADNVVDAGEYRALCLMALNRESDAMKAVETVVRKEPRYQPSTASPPRLKSLVRDVKQAVLPAILQDSYAAAKRDFDAHQFDQAVAEFRTVIAVIDDPALAEHENVLLRDLKTLAAGFLDIIAASRAPAPVVPAAAAVVAPDPPVAPVRERIYTASDTDVTPPITLTQELPVWNPVRSNVAFGVIPPGQIEVIIDETGSVESVTLLKPIYLGYDDQVLRAARSWKYSPAQRSGTPVKFGKVIEVSLRPR